ncbi:hypothetical protein GRJ2_001639200 [Grus japonensis]|uniref:Uncharacterized protein n=1 Tax=Grus japonensis TaxID=30415 RepID=A0ABC9X406_GRUJA
MAQGEKWEICLCHASAHLTSQAELNHDMKKEEILAIAENQCCEKLNHLKVLSNIATLSMKFPCPCLHLRQQRCSSSESTSVSNPSGKEVPKFAIYSTFPMCFEMISAGEDSSGKTTIAETFYVADGRLKNSGEAMLQMVSSGRPEAPLGAEREMKKRTSCEH